MTEHAAGPSGRVAIFLPDLRPGGAERVLLDLCRYFRRRDIAVDLLLARARGPLLAEVPDGVRLIDLAAALALPSRAGLALGALIGLARYLRREPPAALAASLTGANLVAVVARRLAGTDVHLVLREANTADNLSGPFMRRWARALYASADVVIAVSEGVRDDLISTLGVPADRVRVIHNPVDLQALDRLADAPLQDPWFAPDAPPVILGAGRLVPQKDFAILLRAFALLRRNHDARLMLLGEGPLRPALERLAAELGVAGDVALPGFLSNPFPHMRRAAVFALSSRWEGMPNVLVQALAVGTPVVATDCRSGPREILDGGRFGRLVPVGDAPALAEALEKTLAGDLPAEAAARMARAQRFSLDAIAPQYLDALTRGS